MFLSGVAGLGYQIVWSQQNALWLGHESAGVLAVVAAFFGGFAVGAVSLGSRIEQSDRPVRWYIGCELTIAFWSLILGIAMPSVTPALLGAIGSDPSAFRQWFVSFTGVFLLLLPATAAMGATLPAMERMTSGRDRSVSTLYSANTFGAVVGVIGTAFWLLPEWGLIRTGFFCATLNIVCAIVASTAFESTVPRVRVARQGATSNRFGMLARLGVTGFLGIGYEVLVVRVLGQVTEGTVYTFALLLAVYLFATALGAAGYQRWFAMSGEHPKQVDGLIASLSIACLFGFGVLQFAQDAKSAAIDLLGSSMTSALTVEAVLALLAFAPPAFFMGALFCHLSNTAMRSGVSLGAAVGLNTFGAAMAPAAFGVVAMPLLGPKASILLIAVFYLFLCERPRPGRVVALPVAIAFALFVVSPPLAFVTVPQGGRVVSYRDGIAASVGVTEDADGTLRLRIDNHQQEGSSSTRFADARQAWLPLMLHSNPSHVLFLGLGAGVTAASAAEDPRLHVDAVELVPEVIEASHYFIDDRNGASSPLHVITADARRYVRTTSAVYDVIVSDNFHPARSGSGALYTVEHFAAVRERLGEDGLFCQWLPMHQLDLSTLRSIVRSFQEVFPEVGAILASNSLDTPVIGLIGLRIPHPFDVGSLRARFAAGDVRERLSTFGMQDEFDVLGAFVADAESLRRFSEAAPINTDDRPIVAYRAPRIAYSADSSARERLLEILHEVGTHADRIVGGQDRMLHERFSSYWVARNRFIAAGVGVRPSSDVKEMLSQVRDPLLSILKISPDFRPAYDPLMRMAHALAPIDGAESQLLLSELSRLRSFR